MNKISIHALRVECDVVIIGRILFPEHFNPRTPCGVRLIQILTLFLIMLFQSTHSVWSATDNKNCDDPLEEIISIHALRVECDVLIKRQTKLGFIFQSTHSVWSATDNKNCDDPLEEIISIHALRVECDTICLANKQRFLKFQSTHSVWSATEYVMQLCQSIINISIHALRVECDSR